MPYAAPVEEIRFLLDRVVGFDRVRRTGHFTDATPDMVDQLLAGAGRLSDQVLAPLGRIGDTDPARLDNGIMRTPRGFADGYRAIATGGWIGLAADPAQGGAGLPRTLAMAVWDMMAGACLSLQLSPLLTASQIEALEGHGSEALRAVYLPRLISGEWSGTMAMSEPQAGSDVGAVACRAVPRGDGTHALTGQKIWISWGDSDFVDNVCHLVLARLPDAPEGSRGLSLFMVPRNLPDSEGEAGAANALHVVGVEHKLGLHGAPTCVMQFDAATAWLVGAPHEGLAAMFTMMNHARLAVGVQGVGVAEAACQQALAYARKRRQGRSARPDATGAIVDHADVRRMLAVMRAETDAARALALSCAVAADMARATGAPEWRDRAGLLTPLAKVAGTEAGARVADLNIQVHGGAGYVEETGAAQLLRDVRVTAIYEGTNGIQAMDLVGRKLRDGGEAAFRLLDEVEAGAEAARHDFPDLARPVWEAAETLRETTEWMVARDDPDDRCAGAMAYLRAFVRLLGGHHHLTAAMAEPGGRRPVQARVYMARLLPEHAALCAEACAGAGDLFASQADGVAA